MYKAEYKAEKSTWICIDSMALASWGKIEPSYIVKSRLG